MKPVLKEIDTTFEDLFLSIRLVNRGVSAVFNAFCSGRFSGESPAAVETDPRTISVSISLLLKVFTSKILNVSHSWR